MTIASQSTNRHRLLEVDSLRGIAAVMVMLFHYTTRYEDLYGHNGDSLFALPRGHYGVNLFFCISGFVIFMTLARTKKPMDFVVSRLTRLYPAYWVAVLLTFGITHWLGLPGKEVSGADAVLNVLMFQGLLFVPDVDAVYWTLVVELIFYVWAFVFFVSGQLRRVPLALALVLLLRIVAPHLSAWFGFELPWRVTSLLILTYIPWFACGIAIYRIHSGTEPNVSLALIALAALSLLQDSWLLAVMAPALSLVLYLAASGRLGWLRTRVAVWFGAISYTLYLLHENIGWAVMRRLEQINVSTPVAIACAIVITLILAELLRRWIEQPAMRWLRDAYKRHANMGALEQAASSRRVIAALILLFCVTPVIAWIKRPHTASTAQQLGLQEPSPAQEIDCALVRAQHPLVLLLLGQSNAGNHGQADAKLDGAPLFIINGSHCYQSHDPLPGATGHGASIWSHLPAALSQHDAFRSDSRPLAFSLLAIESTTIRDWTEYGTLTTQLKDTLNGLRRINMKPDLVLWQQGEADALRHTSSAIYFHRLQRLIATLRTHDIASPVLLARSTACQGSASPAIHAALDQATRELPGVFAGADTDTLLGDNRADGCHFSATGLSRAAALWSDRIAAQLAQTGNHEAISSR